MKNCGQNNSEPYTTGMMYHMHLNLLVWFYQCDKSQSWWYSQHK